MGCVLRGRSKALGVEGHLRQVGIQGYGRRPMDTLWDTMWIPYGIPCGVPYGVHCGDLGTLGGTLRTPGSSRETQERLKKRLKRDSRQSQDSLKTVSTTPKAWIPKSEKSEMRSEPSHRNSSSSNTE